MQRVRYSITLIIRKYYKKIGICFLYKKSSTISTAEVCGRERTTDFIRSDERNKSVLLRALLQYAARVETNPFKDARVNVA